MKKRILSIALALMMLLSIVPFSAYALEAADYALTGGTVTVDGTADKTVNVVFSAKSAVTVIALQGSFAENSDYLTLSSYISPVELTGTNYFDTPSGAFVYADAALEGYAVSANGNVMTAVYTIAKDTPAGTYEVTLNLKTVQDYDFNEVKNQTYTATITVTNNSTPDEPVAPTAKYTVTATADKAEVEVGGTVTVDVTVSGAAFNGMQAVLTYDTNAFTMTSVSGTAANDNAATTGKVELYAQFNNTAYADGAKVATLVFKAVNAGTAQFGFDTATAGAYADFVNNAEEATKVAATVTAYNTYNVTVNAAENGTVTATPATGLRAGDTVTLNVTPANGYELDTLTVICNGAAVAVSNNKFTMPEGNVTVTATFKSTGLDYQVETTEYVTGVSLVTVTGDNAAGYTYNGNAMYKVAAYGENVYVWLVKGTADKTLVAEAATGTAPVIAAGYDVNGTGKVDFNDAGAAFGCYNGAYDVVEYMAMFLRADVNGDKTVDAADVNAVLAAY